MAKAKKALRNQKLRKRRRKIPIKFILIALAAVIAIGAGYLGINLLRDTAPTHEQVQPIAWQININAKNLNQRQRQLVHDTFVDAAPAGTEDELTFAAQLIQTKLAVERVRVVRTNTDSVSVFIKPRRAHMRVFTGKDRLLSESGQIFGHSEEKHAALPLLTGIPMNDVYWQKDGTLGISEESQKLVGQAVELFKGARKKNLTVRKIEYIPYRGFALTRAKDDITAIVGFAPFDDKLSRLIKLIEDVKKKGSHVERIELDYQGKAFIKEKM